MHTKQNKCNLQLPNTLIPWFPTLFTLEILNSNNKDNKKMQGENIKCILEHVGTANVDAPYSPRLMPISML